MRLHGEEQKELVIDYSKEIVVNMTLAELMLIKAMAGEASNAESEGIAGRAYGVELAEVVTEFDVCFNIYKGAMTILLKEGIQ
ncbi:MAG: hypothetical protein LC650_04885 [Actinobacteria bacterium]|nr:hypothetical protein [Actinomycetota bacterium]